MLFKDILSNNFRVFSRMSEDEYKRNVATVNYIVTMAGNIGVDVSSWDCQALFSANGANKLLEKRHLINEIFFREVERIKSLEQAPVDDTFDISRVIRHVDAQIKRAKQNLIGAVEQSIEDTMRNIRDSENRLIEYYTKLNKFCTERDIYKGRVLTSLHADLSVVNTPRSAWRIKEVTNSAIIFETKNDIVLSHNDHNAGMNIAVNFGKASVEWRMADRLIVMNTELYVRLKARPEGFGGTRHAHVSSGGTPCWGTIAGSANEALREFNVQRILHWCMLLLNNYNAESAYTSLATFHLHSLPRAERERVEIEFEQRREHAARIRRGDIPEGTPFPSNNNNNVEDDTALVGS
jgi:hypothetical protein